MSETLKRIAAQLRALPTECAATKADPAKTGVTIYDHQNKRLKRVDLEDVLYSKVISSSDPSMVGRRFRNNLSKFPFQQEVESEKMYGFITRAGNLLAIAVRQGAFATYPDLCELIREWEAKNNPKPDLNGDVNAGLRMAFWAATEHWLWLRRPELVPPGVKLAPTTWRCSDDPSVFRQNCEALADLIEIEQTSSSQPAADCAPQQPTSKASSEIGAERFQFYRDGGVWVVRFESESGQFPDQKGFGIIAELLRHPDPAAPSLASDLMRYGLEGNTEQSRQPTMGWVEIAKCRERLIEIERELKTANDAENDDESEKLSNEKDGILDQLQKHTGLGGASRSIGPASPAEKSRVAVKKRIDRAIKKLKGPDGKPLVKLVQHLTCIKTEGNSYAYRPANQLPWLLEKPAL